MRFLFSVLFFMINQAGAVTLQHLAQSSNILLTITDRLQNDKSEQVICGLRSPQDVSDASQKLLILIDDKIRHLTSRDYQIIQQRIKTCEKDCSCDIYSLALEKKEVINSDLEKKASAITMNDRKICTKNFQNICSHPGLKTILKNYKH